VERPDVDLRTERFYRRGAKREPVQLADLVGERLAGAADLAVDLVEVRVTNRVGARDSRGNPLI